MKILKKKWIMLAVALALLLNASGACRAEILPPFGEGQIGLLAAVLCESLTVRKEPSASSEAVKTLKYRDLINVTELTDGWAFAFLGDEEGAASGWVNADYIVIDPAWYRTEARTPVYAWKDAAAPKVALLEANTVFLDPDTFLPILKDEGDWLIVSLRGATGWIQKTDAERLSAETIETIRAISGLKKAELTTPKGAYTLTDEAGLAWIAQSFSAAQPIKGTGCPFDATLTLLLEDGRTVSFSVATDSCRNFRTEDGSCFAYGDADEALRQYGSTSIISETFWQLFGLTNSYEDIYQ